MSFDSSDHIKEQVRQATDLVDLVSRSVALRRQGKFYVGLCPWHDDSRPSLQVNPERQSWKCWVCDIGGDIFTFVMKREGVDFPTALRMLAERAGIAWQPRRGQRAEPGSPGDRQTLYRALAWAEQQFHTCLLHDPAAEPARQYLLERGISADSIRRFHLGFSPDRWQWLLDQAGGSGFSVEVLEAAGLVLKSRDNRRYYDRFRGRLIFSIRDTEERPVAFGGRILPSAADSNSPKYVNSPESRVFTKSNHLYALDLVRLAVARDRHIVVVEGYTDVIMAHQCGLDHVVAVLGTALGPRHIRLLRRFADRVTLVLDGDEAGQRRTNEILGLFVAEQMDLRILTLPAGLDPCDFLRHEGGDAFGALLQQAVDALEHKVRVAMRGLDPVQDPSRAHQVLEDILKTLAGAPQLPQAATGSIFLRQQQMLARLAREFHVDESALRFRLSELRTVARRRAATAAADPVTELPPRLQLTVQERELFEILVVHPPLASLALQKIEPEYLTTEPARQLWSQYLALELSPEGIEFERVLTALEDERLKNLLVQLDESARGKDAKALEEAEVRLQGLIRSWEDERQRRAQAQTLEQMIQSKYDEQEEAALLEQLEQMIQHERNRQGISAPTDG